MRTVIARVEGAGFPFEAGLTTWDALLLDQPLPAETAPLVVDIARLPFSLSRYQEALNQALAASIALVFPQRPPRMRVEAPTLLRVRLSTRIDEGPASEAPEAEEAEVSELQELRLKRKGLV